MKDSTMNAGIENCPDPERREILERVRAAVKAKRERLEKEGRDTSKDALFGEEPSIQEFARNLFTSKPNGELRITAIDYDKMRKLAEALDSRPEWLMEARNPPAETAMSDSRSDDLASRRSRQLAAAKLLERAGKIDRARK